MEPQGGSTKFFFLDLIKDPGRVKALRCWEAHKSDEYFGSGTQEAGRSEGRGVHSGGERGSLEAILLDSLSMKQQHHARKQYIDAKFPRINYICFSENF